MCSALDAGFNLALLMSHDWWLACSPPDVTFATPHPQSAPLQPFPLVDELGYIQGLLPMQEMGYVGGVVECRGSHGVPFGIVLYIVCGLPVGFQW